MRSRWLYSRDTRLVAWAVSAELAAAALLLGGGIARQHCEVSAVLRAASAPNYEAAEAAYAQRQLAMARDCLLWKNAAGALGRR